MSLKLLTPAVVLEDKAGWDIVHNHHAASLQVRPVWVNTIKFAYSFLNTRSADMCLGSKDQLGNTVEYSTISKVS